MMIRTKDQFGVKIEYTLLVGMQNGMAVLENCGGSSKKLRLELPYNLAIPNKIYRI